MQHKKDESESLRLTKLLECNGDGLDIPDLLPRVFNDFSEAIRGVT